MKKLAAILLIVLFAFNLFGYKVLFYFAEKQSDINIEKVLDSNAYNEQDLLTIKIPMLVSYQVEQKDFERFDGEITLDGKIYKYVKRKVSDGNLVLLCLRDHSRTQLETAKNDLVKSNIDLQNTSSKKPGNSKVVVKDFSNEYNESVAEYMIGFNSALNNCEFLSIADPLSSSPHSSPEQPPELI